MACEVQDIIQKHLKLTEYCSCSCFSICQESASSLKTELGFTGLRSFQRWITCIQRRMWFIEIWRYVEKSFYRLLGFGFCLLLKKANDPELLRNPFLTELYPNCCCSCWAGLYRMSKPFDSPRGCIRHLLWLWQHFREREGLLGYRGLIFACLLMFWEKPWWCFCVVEHNPGFTR